MHCVTRETNQCQTSLNTNTLNLPVYHVALFITQWKIFSMLVCLKIAILSYWYGNMQFQVTSCKNADQNKLQSMRMISSLYSDKASYSKYIVILNYNKSRPDAFLLLKLRKEFSNLSLVSISTVIFLANRNGSCICIYRYKMLLMFLTVWHLT